MIFSLRLDPEDRLTTISSPAFSAAYDGDGLRIKKTATPIGGSAAVTTYFLYDGGHLLLEETWNGTAASLANVNGWAADGLRARLENGVAYDFAYDPQGNLIQRQSAGAYTVGYAAYDQAIYEGYGALRQDVKLTASKTGGAATTPRDPVGFGGQFGYYTDTETGLLCLTHRYYDPGTGKFINRDPIGYEGGANLYGFADGNPVNESDPSGFNPNQDKIVSAAQKNLDSVKWGPNAAHTVFGCNVFVGDTIVQAGLPAPHVPGKKGYPNSAQWAAGNVVGWKVVPNNQAQPGDVIAEAHQTAHASGHCAISMGGDFTRPKVWYNPFNWVQTDQWIGTSGEDGMVRQRRAWQFGYDEDTGVLHPHTTLRYVGNSIKAHVARPKHTHGRRR